MKKLLFILLSICFLCGFAGTAGATLLTDVDILSQPLTNFNPTYWVGEDDNVSDWKELVNSNTETEEAWLKAILGLPYNNPGVAYYSKTEYPEDAQPVALNNFFPGFSFEYAVVKYGNYWAAYGAEQVGDRTVLDTGVLPKEISHVTYFNGTPVPEPSTMLLLGFGLMGLAAFGRKRFF